jgi:hypothetical protein
MWIRRDGEHRLPCHVAIFDFESTTHLLYKLGFAMFLYPPPLPNICRRCDIFGPPHYIINVLES